ncbi:MAG: pilus assembly protein [Bdellovibrionales bacterium]|nr:pilus assembly protein [Bdellovibrionales bacterium]
MIGEKYIVRVKNEQKNFIRRLPSRLSESLLFISDSHGYSLLDFAITLPVLLIILFGAIDLNTGIQAYSALQSGVQSAVRCTTTTDGDCLQTATVDRTPYYNWVAYEAGSTLDPWGYNYRYGGREINLTAPRFQIGDYRAYRLGSVSYSLETNSAQVSKLYFPAEGTRPKVLKSRLPRVLVTRGVGSTPHVEFRHQAYRGRKVGDGNYDFSRAPLYTNSMNLRGISLSSSATGDVSSGSSSFTLNSVQGIACRISEDFNEPDSSAHEPGNQPCNDRKFWNEHGYNNDYQEIVIYIEASTSVTLSQAEIDAKVPNVAEGNVSLSVNGRSLGGRQFTSSQGMRDGSLCPRGVPPGYLENQSGCQETDIHTKIVVPTGKPISVSLSLRKISGNGTINWNTSRILVFYPEFAEGWQNWKSCIGGYTVSQMNNGMVECAVAGKKVDASVFRPIRSGNFPNNFIKEEPVPSVTHLTHSPVTAITPLDCTQHPELSADDCSDLFAMGSTPSVSSDSQGCPVDNSGDGINSSGALTDQNWAAQRCPVNPSFIASKGTLIPGTESWSVEPVSFPNSQPVEWNPTDCSYTTPSVPSEVKQFKNHTYRTTLIGSTPLEPLGRNVDPRETLQTPRFSCTINGAGFSTESTYWNAQTREEKFFHNVHPEYEMGCAEEAWQKKVRTKVTSLGLAHNAFFVPERYSPDQSIPENSAEDSAKDREGSSSPTSSTMSPVPVAVFEELKGSCPFVYSPGQPESKLGVFNGTCNTPDTAPVACDAPGVVCIKQFAGFCGETAEIGTGQTPLEAEAEAIFYSRVQSTYPRARPQCEGANCVRLRPVASTYDASPGSKQNVAFEGEIETPLLLGRVFGTQTFTFRYRDQGVLESEFAR